MQSYIVTYRCPVTNCGEEMVLPLDAPSDSAVREAPGPHCPRHRLVTTKPVDFKRSWYRLMAA